MGVMNKRKDVDLGEYQTTMVLSTHRLDHDLLTAVETRVLSSSPRLVLVSKYSKGAAILDNAGHRTD